MSQFISPILVLTSLFLALPVSAEPGLYKKISPACLEILVGGRLDGSGSIVCSSGLVLTACHVIRKQNKKYEALSPSTWQEATKSCRHLPWKRSGSSQATQKAIPLTPHCLWPNPSPPKEDRCFCLVLPYSAITLF